MSTAPAAERGDPVAALTASRARRGTIQVVALALLLAFWELSAADASRALISPPSEILRAAYQLTVVEPIIWRALLTTAQAFFLGYAIAVGAGIAIGTVMGRSRVADYVLDPYVTFGYAVPSIALIPLLVIWFGIGDTLRVVLVVIASIFP